MNLTRRGLLLSAGAAAAVGPRIARAAPSGVAKNLIVVLADGGWDVTYLHDPKLGGEWVEGPEVDQNLANPLDVEAVRTYGSMPIVVNDSKRPNVGAFFDRWWDRTTIVNGISVGSIAHQSCRVRVLTGTGTSANPDFVSIVGHTHSDDLPLGSLDFSGLGITGPLAASTGRIGARNQIKTLLDPSSSFAPPKGAGYTLPLISPDDTERDLVRSYLENRATRWRAAHPGDVNAALVTALHESLERGDQLRLEAPPLVEQLTMGATPDLALQSSLAATALENGIARAALLMHPYNWDTHQDNSQQHAGFNALFASLDTLLDELATRDMLDSTLVVVLSEMTRTPMRNAGGGKDHWPHTSALLIGANVRGGETVGATDDYLESLPMDLETGEIDPAKGSLLTYDRFAAGILEQLDVDSQEWLPGEQAFRGAFRS